MIINFLILVIIIKIKSIFSAAETAYTYLNKAKFSQMSKSKKSNKKITKIKEMLDNKLKLYGTTKIGMTLAELLASAFAAEAFVGTMVRKLHIFDRNNILEYTISIIIVTIILSYFTLVFGELIPKRRARNHPEKTAYRTINAIYLFSKINTGFEKILRASEEFFIKLFGLENEEKEKLTEQEIKMIIAEGKDQGIFDRDEKKLLYNALKFDDLKIKNIMIPKDKIVFININDSKEKVLDIIQKSKFTRIPVYEKSRDNIIGILNIKDIIIDYAKNESEFNFNIKNMLREFISVNKNETLDKILKKLKLNTKHIVIVKGEDGKAEGIATMEDILESLVGKIYDEFEQK